MELYLLRHGFAEDRSSTGRDSDRALRAEGVAELEAVLAMARRGGVRPSLILSSPYSRALQTAAIAGRVLGYEGRAVPSSAFSPDSSPYKAWEEIREHAGEGAILVAAHEPLLSSTMAWFAGSTRVMVRFVPAALVRIDFEAVGPHPAGVMRWMICPELIAGENACFT